MIRIYSNIDTELARLRTIRRRWAINARAELATIPWTETAAGALAAATRGQEAQWSNAILRGISITKRDLGITIRASSSAYSVISAGIDAAQKLAGLGVGRPGAVSQGERMGFQSDEHAEAELSLTQANAEEVVAAWVYAPVKGGKYAPDRPPHGVMPPESGKVLTAEDEFEPMIALERVLGVLGFRRLHANAVDSPARVQAARSLTRRIEAFMAAQHSGPPGELGIPEARLMELLRIILEAWTELALIEVPRRIQSALVAAAT